jgi:hypothetical protein
MKQLILVFLFIWAHAAFSQKNIVVPAFGVVDKADMTMTECDFDRNAEAMVLLDVEEVKCREYAYSVFAEVRRHVRIKILKDKGLEFANIKLPYITYRNAESFGTIAAQTYNLDAACNIVVTKLEKKSIYDKALNKRISEKIFTLPGVKPGSIIEYTYEKDASVGAGLNNWEFQHSIPVRLSRYLLDFPEDIEVSSQSFCTLPFDRENRNEHGDNIHIFTMTDIPALRDEPYISCEDDYLQRIESRVVALNLPSRRINLSYSWPEIVLSLIRDVDFGEQLSKTIPLTGDLEQSLSRVSSPYEKMVRIFDYVRDNMNWNGETNIYALDGVKSAWKDKKGTSGEINLILINLLKGANLKAHPMLVSTREHGKINLKDPGFSQFNKVMAYVDIQGKLYVLDATDKFASPKLIPWEVMCSRGLVIEEMETLQWGWQYLWNDAETFKNVVILNVSVSDQGLLSGQAIVQSYDYSRLERVKALKEGQEKFKDKYFTSTNPGMHIDSLSIENQSNDTLPLAQTVAFSQPLNSSGAYRYFSTNLFTGLEKNPFLSESRFSDVYFGANQHYSIITSCLIPEGYSFDALPKNTKLRMADSSIVFTRVLQAEDGHLSMRITLDFKKPFYTTDEYADFREFYKKLFDLLNEQIVLKKEH